MNLTRTLAVVLSLSTCSGIATLAQVFEVNAVGLYQFPFPPGTDLVGQTETSGAKWSAEGAGSPLTIEPGSLSVPGLAAPRGNRVRITAPSAGARVGLPQTFQGGTVFVSAVLRVTDDAGLAAQGAGVLSLGNVVMLSLRPAAWGSLVGVSKSANSPAAWATPAAGNSVIVGGTNRVVVTSYTFVEGPDNDIVRLWANPSPATFGAAEPPAADAMAGEGPDAAQITGLLIHAATSPGSLAAYELDEIRVGATWASVTPRPPALVGFSSGSDGSAGPIVVANNAIVTYEWDFAPNGIINATTVKVAAGATLRFRRNANNTPVYLLATGDVQIDGTIDVSGEPGNAVRGGFGGPGGFDGGQPGSVGVDPGGGHGPGGGRWTGGGFGGPGAHRTGPDANITTPGDGATYGHALQRPPSGGSGGSGHPGAGGGGGGGAILIASNTRIGVGPQGAILSYGGNAVPEHKYNAGAGGSIVLVAPVVEGSGRLAVNGGTGYTGANPRGSAGAGWIRIDALDRSNLSLTYEGSPPSLGTAMLSYITPVITLRITEVAGTPIANAGGPYTIVLPTGADPNIAVKLQAENFKARVPVVLYATPDSGERKAYAVTMDNLGPGAAEATLNLTLPVNQRVTLEAFAGKGLPGGSP